MSEAAVHVHTATHQPATRYEVRYGFQKERRHIITKRPRARVYTQCCKRWRWAQHCTVQVYYDWLPFWCRDGQGCQR